MSLPQGWSGSKPHDPLEDPPDVMGPHEVREFLHLTWPEFNRLRNTDPAFPTSRRLRCGAVWAAQSIRAYDTSRRRMGNYT